MKANKFRLMIRMLSLILALLTVFYILPTSAFAEAALPQNSENQVVSKSEQEKVNEVLAKREDLSSGRATVYVYDTAGRVTEIGEYDISSGRYYSGETLVYNKDGRLSVSSYKLDYTQSSGVDYGTVTNNYQYNENGSLTTYDTRLSSRLGVTYSYDALERLYQSNYQVSGGFKNTVTYEYRTSPHNSSYLSSFVSKYTSVVGRTSTTTTVYDYTYDERGNITGITVGGQQITYEYDDLGQLVRENNQPRGETYVYVYDNAGNLFAKRTYPYTTSQNPSSFISANVGTFGNSAWGDQMTAYKGVQITYDAIGNPLSYYNGTSYTFTWSGRQLKTATKGGVNYSFEYDSDGLRTKKTVGTTNYTYYYADGKLLGQEWGANLIVFLYDESGMPIGMHYRTSSYSSGKWDVYWFERNLHGDVVAIYNNSNTKLASYIYDAWGNHTVTYHNGGGSLTAIVNNPIRYRGYYYDIDLGLYYLQTRYYDSNIGRFINADSALYHDMLGYNMYAYCNNNPVMFVDPYGESAVETMVWWFANFGPAAIVEPFIIGEAILAIGAVAIGVVIVLEFVANAVTGSLSRADEAPKSVTEESGKTTLPNQGEVTEVPGAPPVDAGKQGKHVPGHNNNDPNKSQWKKGETGVKQTQEAWQNGQPESSNPNIRIGKSSDGRTIRVHQDSSGRIHGYPIYP